MASGSGQIVVSGTGVIQFGDDLRDALTQGRPRAVGVAAAFVSIEGVRHLAETLQQSGTTQCRLLAGIDNAVTHPEALYAARDHGWRVRLGRSAHGIFHPKLIVAGRAFNRSGILSSLCYTYVGSSNLTGGGLQRNVECGFAAASVDACLPSGAQAFAALWAAGTAATDAELRNYSARFAERARLRSLTQLVDLGVTDSRPLPTSARALRSQARPTDRAALNFRFAVAAWAELKSFTGEYRFQVEFPKTAGLVISRLMQPTRSADGRVDVYCADDETTRAMQYRFYRDNGMFRLNIPNDVSGVAWARTHKDGLALVEQGPAGGAPLRLRVVLPGAEATDIVGRSAALGTWAKTTTRAYGWF